MGDTGVILFIFLKLNWQPPSRLTPVLRYFYKKFYLMSETLVTSSNVGFQIIFFLHFYNENIWQQTYSRFQSVKEADCVMPSFVLHVNNLSLEQNIGISRTSVVFNTVAPSSSSSVSPVRAGMITLYCPLPIFSNFLHAQLLIWLYWYSI